MKSTWSRVVRGAFLAGLAAAAVSLACTVRRGVETDLYSLLDSSRQSVLRALADNLGGQLRILLEGPDFASLEAPAADFRAYFATHVQGEGERPREPQREGERPREPQREAGTLRKTLAALAPRSGGLLTEETRALLQAGRFDEVATNAATALFSGFLSPLVSVKQDPYLLATDYLTHLQARDDHGWTLRDGDPVCEKDGRCYRLLVFDGFSTSDNAFICDVLARVREFNAATQKRGPPAGGSGVSPLCPVKAYVSGAPFHTALSMERSKLEVNVLSAVSLLFVFALGVWLFRSVRFVIPLLVTLASAFLVATAAVFAIGKPHVLTFVFGTSLIGLGVDYVYHACATEDGRTLTRPLSYALLTTLACFAPLAFSSVGVLRQMALFTSAGLITAWAAVMAWFGRAGARPTPGGSGVPPLQARPAPGGNGVPPLQARPSRRSFFIIYFSFFIIYLSLFIHLCAGAFRIRLSSDPAQFYRPDPFLAEGERKFYELNQAAAARFAVVEGATVQEALEREEAAGVKGLSAIIPSLKRQRENQALVAALREKTGADYTALTGVQVARGADARGLLDPEEVDDPLLAKLVRSMCVKTADGVLLVSPHTGGASVPASRNWEGERPREPYVIEPKRELMELFGAYAREAYRLLGIAFAVLMALLAALFRRRFLACAGPVLAAALATLGVLGWCGVSLTFFHALCFFVCTGLGLDYAIFHLGNPPPRTRRVVFVSFLTSAVAFGMLAFTSFAVTQAMGATLAIGLFFSYLFAASRFPRFPQPTCASRGDVIS